MDGYSVLKVERPDLYGQRVLVRHRGTVDEKRQDFLFLSQAGADFAHERIAVPGRGSFPENFEPFVANDRNDQIAVRQRSVNHAVVIIAGFDATSVDEYVAEAGFLQSADQLVDEGKIRRAATRWLYECIMTAVGNERL